jgi:hypothetical protein
MLPRVPTDLPLRCACGGVRGEVTGFSPARSSRVLCYCRDCRAFARFVGTPGVLDSAGGTEVVFVAPAQLRFTAGDDRLRCVRLSNKGMHRWYTECCRTPVANTGPRMPFVGLIHSFVDVPREGGARDEMLGAALCHSQPRSAAGPLPPDAPPKVNLAHVARIASVLAGWWMRGITRPSPFFDARSKAPRAAPRVLEPSEREALGG